MTAREANELGDTIRNAVHQSVAQRAGGDCGISLLDTDLFADLLHAALLKSPRGGYSLCEPVSECLPQDTLKLLQYALGPEAETWTRHDLVAQDAGSLADLLRVDLAAARRLRLEMLGVPLVKPSGRTVAANQRGIDQK